MSTEILEARAGHIRGVTVTAIASISGVIAGILSHIYAAGASDPVALLIMVGLIVIQFPLLSVTNIIEEFSNKDRLYIGFMTFALWFVTWGILLTTDAEIAI